MSLKHERKAYAKLTTPTGIFYMVTPTIVLGRGPSSVDLILPGDTSISRRQAQIDFLPDLQHFEIRVIGKNGIFVDGTFLRSGDAPRTLRSHTDIIIGRGTPQLLTFFLPSNRAAENKPNKPPGVAPSMLSMVGQVLIAADGPLDAEEIYQRVKQTCARVIDTLGSRAVIEASIRAAIEGNAHIFQAHAAYDLDAQERLVDPGRKTVGRTHAAFSVREKHRLRFLKARRPEEDGDAVMADMSNVPNGIQN